MASSNIRSTNISPSVLRSYHRKLCGLQNKSPPTLHSLAIELHAKKIIDKNTKIDLLKKGGTAGADILLTHVLTKAEQNPEHLDIVQKTLEKIQFLLHDIIEEMKQAFMYTQIKYKYV